MKKITITAGLVLLAGCSVSLTAGDKDFWVARPSSEWTEKEADKLLKNSPWSKSVVLNTLATNRPSRGFEPDAGPQSGATGEEGDQARRSSARDVMRGAGGDFAGDGQGRTLVITWYSRPVREALARRMQLTDPEVTSERVQGVLNYRNPDYFELIVMGWSPRMEGGAQAEIMQNLRDSTFLVKKNKQKISLGGIRFPPEPGQPLVFQFPRLLEGKPSVTVEDKEVDLVTKLARVTIRSRFKLAEMVIAGQLEN